jgi:hypothetical protein
VGRSMSTAESQGLLSRLLELESKLSFLVERVDSIERRLSELASKQASSSLPTERVTEEALTTIRKELESLEKRLERRVQDQLNAFTSKVDSVARAVAELAEWKEGVEEVLKELKQTSAKQSESEGGRPRKGKSRASAMDILREQKVIFESEIAEKIRNRDAFFAKLEKGAR